MKKGRSSGLSANQKKEIDALSSMPEDAIDTREIPERRDWSGAQRGVFFRPIKKQLTLRLDPDLIDWFKAQATDETGYQTRINGALRDYVEQQKGADY